MSTFFNIVVKVELLDGSMIAILMLNVSKFRLFDIAQRKQWNTQEVDGTGQTLNSQSVANLVSRSSMDSVARRTPSTVAPSISEQSRFASMQSMGRILPSASVTTLTETVVFSKRISVPTNRTEGFVVVAAVSEETIINDDSIHVDSLYNRSQTGLTTPPPWIFLERKDQLVDP